MPIPLKIRKRKKKVLNDLVGLNYEKTKTKTDSLYEHRKTGEQNFNEKNHYQVLYFHRLIFFCIEEKHLIFINVLIP